MKRETVLFLCLISALTDIVRLSANKPARIPVLPSQISNPNSQLTNRFSLKIDYACREKTPLKSCLGDVLWNGVIVKQLKPSNYQINNLNLQISVIEGRNVLQIHGDGVSDGHGLTLDNIKLIRNVPQAKNIVINGDFQRPIVNDWKIFEDVKGWIGRIQIGKGKIYNNRWKSQVCELDGSQNNSIQQEFYFTNKFELLRMQKCDNLDNCPECREANRANHQQCLYK